ncbi:MAG: methyltransferase family protein [Acidiferrobacterales bacterium]
MEILLVVGDYWESFSAFALFGALHSICAHEPFKNALGRWTTPFFVEHFWRFIYNALSYTALYYWIAVLHWGKHPESNVWIIDYPEPFWRILVVLHLFSIFLFYVSFLQSDYLEFLGLKQMWRGLRHLFDSSLAVPELKLFGTHRLEVKGVYAWIRHPMLIAGFLFLATSGPSRNNLVFLFMYTTYMLIGAYYEERRLVRIFGEQYMEYRRQVGAFLPRLRRARAVAGQ